MVKEGKAPLSYKIALGLGVLAVACLWFLSNPLRLSWPGVPPVPSKAAVYTSSLSDAQFSYRASGLTIQNLGDTGGNITPLTEYDYERLSQWFELSYDLDPRSNFYPMLAAYYFGATPKTEDLRYLVDYLAKVGADPRGEKWRWLVQAIYITRFKLGDLDQALKYAEVLGNLQQANSDRIPLWTRQMSVFIVKAKGDAESARELMMTILATSKNLHPNEINFMQAFIEGDL